MNYSLYFNQKWSRLLIFLLVVLISFLAGGSSVHAKETSRGNLGNDVLYYIAVDRFFDGDKQNNIPKISFPMSSDLDPSQQAYNRINQLLLEHTFDPNHRYTGMFWGGDLKGILEKLDYLQDLGVTQLVLSPIQDSSNGLVYTPGIQRFLHAEANPIQEEVNPFYASISTAFDGKWIKDWFEIDEHFYDSDLVLSDHFDSLRNLLNQAGERHIGIILELGMNSTSPYRGSVSYKPFDLSQAEQWLIDQGAVYRQGQQITPFLDPNTSELDPYHWFHPPLEINYSQVTQLMLENGWVAGLPDLDQDNPQVRNYFLDTIRFWLTFNQGGHQISGLYLTEIPHISLDFWQEIEKTLDAVNPAALLIGEYSGGGYTNRKGVKWYTDTQKYSWVDYDTSLSARHYFSGERQWDGRTYLLREKALGHRGQYYTYSLPEKLLHFILNPSESLEIPRHSLDLIPDQESLSWVKFIDHHDQPRLLTQHPDLTEQAYRSLLQYMIIAPGIPMLMYGMETGLAVPYHIDHQGIQGIGGHPFNEPMMIWPGEPGWNNSLFQTTRQLLHLRQEHPALRYGETEFLFPQGSKKDQDLFMLREFCTTLCDRVLYAYSTSGGQFQVYLQLPIQTVFSVDQQKLMSLKEGYLSLDLGPEEAQILLLQ